ncbi:hypothetical protein SELMODRAFT_451150 [Selaginella moellendorffii]|uniref:Uncharacterized protein n=1 Tax=Selaginella moellendorffii TaxID=88036 RepID=D8RI63_SELML|nr:poly(A)-specific ribonuclease PARN [Selaginella moellendorffii]EFJ28195.1 hypothetical protein SELMODRAFT_451150 [Selaginella moellendorffii]|eukprot:XP_002970869.1 poly(A)-specific ribonuclease PARN [Selaginella moellendorffii]
MALWRALPRRARVAGSGIRLFCSAVVRDSSHAITRQNFGAAFQRLKGLLREADFVAMDLEMSGVHSAPWRKSMELDTLETRYHNVRDSAEKFSLLQCGLCLFRYDQASSKFLGHPFNFFLFPRNELVLERDFLCQTSSLEFLAKHHFDFNACIYNGISYLSRKEEGKLRALLAKKGEDELPEVSMRKTSDLIFSERVRLQVGLWRASKIMAKHKAKQEESSGRSSMPDDEAPLPSLVINVSDKRQAKLVLKAVSSNFDDLVPMIEDNEKEATQVKVIYTGSSEHKIALQADLDKAKLDLMECDVMEAVGFRQVIDAISESKKPIVGHNCVLDLAHIYNKFIGPLPDNYSGFCNVIHELFPAVIDTKYMLKVLRTSISTTSLYPVYSYYFGEDAKKNTKTKAHSTVNVEIADGFHKYSDAELKHEAGFDAYMTGAIFAQLWRTVVSNPTEFYALSKKILRGTHAISEFSNLLYMGWAGHFVLDLKTGKEAKGSKALPERESYSARRPASDAAVIVWSQDPVGSSRQLQKLVKSCFEETQFSSEVEVIPVSENAAFLAFKSLRSSEEFSQALESIKTKRKKLNTIAARLSSSGLEGARFGTFEKLCKSELSTFNIGDAIQSINCFSDDELAASIENADAPDDLQVATVQG